ncbi:deoxynucleoside triphosphate triphosphohydrolase SAMHD1-like [Ptychodera flava]|uniref:deoxynucleoside triphosphate triphosphohydrolase SAMHD1-like n=1 Tax=Ptychodera flava TaxID=63121 RepID=UPI00396A8039
MIYGPLGMDNPELYKEIISNKTNEIDVDKWDYFARDSYHLGVRFTFQHDRFIKFSKVLNVSEKGPRKRQICFRDKEAINVYQMFHTRYTLYRMACYHPITVGMEAMITDALLAAAKHLTLTKRNGSTFKLQDAISDMDAYQQLDDNILTLILHSNVDNLKEARQILERVQKRDIYKCVDRIPVKEDKDPEQEDTIREDIVQCEANEGLLKADDLLVQIIKIDYGMKDKNPVDCVLFFSKEDPDKPKSIRQDEVSHLLPKTFQERQVFIFVKKASERDRAKLCVAEWRKKTYWVTQKVGTDIPTVKSMSEGSEAASVKPRLVLHLKVSKITDLSLHCVHVFVDPQYRD